MARFTEEDASGNKLKRADVSDMLSTMNADGGDYSRADAQAALIKYGADNDKGYYTSHGKAAYSNWNARDTGSAGGSTSGQDTGANATSSLEDLLRINPQLAEQAFGIASEYGPKYAELDYQNLAKYQPLLAQLGIDMSSEYSPQYQALAEQLRSSDRTADLGDISRLAPELLGIRDAAGGPEVTAMRNMLRDRS